MNSTTVDIHGLTQRTPSVRRIMGHVLVALIPGTIIYALVIDARILVNILLACVIGVCCEAVCLSLRHRPIRPALSDGSVILASWLLTLCVPPSLPYWQLVIGVLTLVTLGKHLFGGLGHNPFNPAMVAYAVLLISFPVTMTHWELSEPSGFNYSLLSSNSSPPGNSLSTPKARRSDPWDAITGATVLDRLRELKRQPYTGYSLPDRKDSRKNEKLQAQTQTQTQAQTQAQTQTQTQTSIPAAISSEQVGSLIMQSPWIWVSLAWLAGGVYLLMLKVISWHIPVSFILSLGLLYALAGLITESWVIPIVPALLSGAVMLGAFFIATDPVTAAASRQGKLIYGAGIGILTFVIREFSSYPEGVAFAVLLMNICVPLIDYLSTGRRGNLAIPGKR